MNPKGSSILDVIVVFKILVLLIGLLVSSALYILLRIEEAVSEDLNFDDAVLLGTVFILWPVCFPIMLIIIFVNLWTKLLNKILDKINKYIKSEEKKKIYDL